MPLVLLGLILIIGIVVYAIIKYMNSGESDTRPVRERYPHAFPAGKKNPDEPAAPLTRYRHNPFEPDIRRAEDTAEDSNIKHTEDGNIIFPTDNVETEKHKRNIH